MRFRSSLGGCQAASQQVSLVDKELLLTLRRVKGERGQFLVSIGNCCCRCFEYNSWAKCGSRVTSRSDQKPVDTKKLTRFSILRHHHSCSQARKCVFSICWSGALNVPTVLTASLSSTVAIWALMPQGTFNPAARQSSSAKAVFCSCEEIGTRNRSTPRLTTGQISKGNRQEDDVIARATH